MRSARTISVWAAIAVLVSTSPARAGFELQGFELQGTDLGGFSTNGKEVLVSFAYDGMKKGKTRLTRVRVEKGGLVGRKGRAVLRGTGFAGVHLVGRLDTGGGTSMAMEFRIAAVSAEDRKYEPDSLPRAARGGTFLYELQYRDLKEGWRSACKPDADGKKVAIPVAAVFTRGGKRVESTKHFTLSCTTGVVAKCYRWGYRPWYAASRADPHLFRRGHWSCTRMARADYCGDGFSRTRNGTLIYEYDSLDPQVAPPPKSIPMTMIFESGWSTCGAVCLNKFRWQQWPAVCPQQTSCLYRVVAAATGTVVQQNVCDTPAEAAKQVDQQGRKLRLFNLSNKNVLPPTQ